MAVITVEPAGKTSVVYSYMQARLMSQLNGEWLMSLVCVSKPLITVYVTMTHFATAWLSRDSRVILSK